MKFDDLDAQMRVYETAADSVSCPVSTWRRGLTVGYINYRMKK